MKSNLSDIFIIFIKILLIILFLKLPITFGLQCQRITVTSCQGLGYNMTALPNLSGDQNNLDAELKITNLLPLLESSCSKHIRFLLCSSIFPLCTPDVPKPVIACKSLCEKVKEDCTNVEPQLIQLWPEYLKCEELPQPEKHELCMQIPEEDIKIEKNHQQQQHAVNLFWPWLSWKMSTTSSSATSNHHLTKSSLFSKVICPMNFTGIDGDCIPQCNTDAMYTGQQKKIAEALILALAAVCFIVTLFSLVTFWAEPTRFGYPERPVLFLCLCYNLLSVCYLERIVFHNPIKENQLYDNDELQNNGIIGLCNLSPPCLASYITTSYLTLCAAWWWLIFALCFYLSSNKKWSSEALEKKAGVFHVLSWVPPLGPPIGALLWGAVKPNELTGMCTAPGFVEIPALILLTFGIIFTLRASQSLKSLQEQTNNLRTPANECQQRFAQIRKRVLIFSLSFFIPTVISIILPLFERFDIHVPACLSTETCEQPEKLTAIPILVRLCLHLMGGTLTGMWVWSRKTCESYRNRITTTTPTTISPTSSYMTTTSSTVKSASSLPKKLGNNNKQITPLYSGINFHNVPIYNGHSRV